MITRAPKIIIVLFVSVMVLATGQTNNASAQSWDELLANNITEFPDINHISTQELYAWLNDPNQLKPILLDARSKKEYRVSHLINARHVKSIGKLNRILRGVDKTTPIVTYCSVGARSGIIAQELQNRGYTNVYNLNGSIFGWANEGKPVYRGNIEVSEVHPFDEDWGRFLNKQYHPKIKRNK